jgi:hypothetical protein
MVWESPAQAKPEIQLVGIMESGHGARVVDLLHN